MPPTCSICAHGHPDPMHSVRVECAELPAVIQHDYDVQLAGPVYVRADSPACACYAADAAEVALAEEDEPGDPPPPRPHDPFAGHCGPGNLVHEVAR